MSWPPHQNPPEGAESIAPYNFVPLPNRVLLATQDGGDPEKLHDRYHRKRHTGWIDLKLTTETPLYTRCAYSPDIGDIAVNVSIDKQQFYHRGNHEIPYIPGSSIRGMIRSLVEILSFSKITAVKDRHLFFRTMNSGVLKDEYMETFIKKGEYDDGAHGVHPAYKLSVEAGILQRAGGKYSIKPYQITRVSRDILKKRLETELYYSHPGTMTKTPSWNNRDKIVYVKLGPEADWHFHPIKNVGGNLIHDNIYLWHQREVLDLKSKKPPDEPGWTEGILVVTGDMSTKKMEFVFVPASEDLVPIDRVLVEEIENNDQITNWQERAFNENEPDHNCRRANGSLRDGEPVFYITGDLGVSGIGRAQMFRLRYRNTTLPFVPANLSNNEGLDLTETLFGTVRKGWQGEGSAIKGRLSFEDAWLCPTSNEASVFLTIENGGRLSPKILSGPKPTSFQHYLVQTNPNKAVRHYNSEPETDTVIRGHKLYWHKKEASEPHKTENHEKMFEANLPPPKDTQHTIMRPIRPGVVFRSRIHFENLSNIELGALLTALDLPPSMRHKLGMGKPLGLGSIKLIPILHLVDRVLRYESLEATGEKDCVETGQVSGNIKSEFQKTIVERVKPKSSFWKIPRMKMLARLLEWDYAQPQEKTRYVPIREADGDTNGAQWKVKKILPSPDASFFNLDAIEQLSPVAPVSKPKYEKGQKIIVKVLSIDTANITLELPDGSPFPFKAPYFQGKIGDMKKMKVMDTDNTGTRIKQLVPA